MWIHVPRDLSGFPSRCWKSPPICGKTLVLSSPVRRLIRLSNRVQILVHTPPYFYSDFFVIVVEVETALAILKVRRAMLYLVSEWPSFPFDLESPHGTKCVIDLLKLAGAEFLSSGASAATVILYFLLCHSIELYSLSPIGPACISSLVGGLQEQGGFAPAVGRAEAGEVEARLFQIQQETESSHTTPSQQDIEGVIGGQGQRNRQRRG